MSLKMILVTVLVIALAGIAFAFFRDGKSRPKVQPDKKRKIKDDSAPLPSQISELDKIFPVQPIGSITTEPLVYFDTPVDAAYGSNDDSIESDLGQFRRNKFLLPKDAAHMLSRLNILFEQTYVVVPRVAITDIVRANVPPGQSPDDETISVLKAFGRAYFDFVLLDPTTSQIKLVMLAHEQADRTESRDLLLSVLNHVNLPVYLYDRLSQLSDNELAVELAEAIEGGMYA